MKKKSKTGHGGARPGAGARGRWKHGRTKLVRLPVALVDKILEVARYMDQNEGRLPFSAPVLMIPDYPAETSSAEERRKELFAQQRARRLVEEAMLRDEQV
jgi:hypothetical protein